MCIIHLICTAIDKVILWYILYLQKRNFIVLGCPVNLPEIKPICLAPLVVFGFLPLVVKWHCLDRSSEFV